MKVNISVLERCVKAGLTLAQMSKKLGVSKPALLRHLNKLASVNRIYRVSHYPAIWEIMTPERTAKVNASMGSIEINKKTVNGPDLNGEATRGNPNRILEPHHDGSWFKLVSGVMQGGRVDKKFGHITRHRWKDRDFSIVGYAGKEPKFVIWSRTFKGFSPEEQLLMGRKLRREKAASLAKRYGWVVEYLKPAGNAEFTTTQVAEGLSREAIKGFELKGGPVQVAPGVVAKTDSSHPKRMEFAEGVARATVAGQRFHDLLLTDVPSRLDVLEASTKAELDGAFKVVKQLTERLSVLEARVEPAFKPDLGSERRETG